MSISIYTLSCYPILDTTLDEISKIAKNFLWGRGCRNNGIHYVGWLVTTLDKTDGGLGIRNLRKARIALMDKNIFSRF